MSNTNVTDSSKIEIDSTSYSVQERWLDMAAKYFNVDIENNESISMLKAGLFGYFNEIASNEIKNSTYHRNFLYDEHFLNSASAYRSIYNFAKLYDVPVDSAIPSRFTATMVISKEDLINSELKEDITTENSTLKTYKITLDKNYIFNIQNYNFLLPYPIEIILKQTLIDGNLDYSITAKYDTENSNFPFLNLTSPYLKIWQDYNNINQISTEKYVFIVMELFQLERKVTQFTVTSDDISEALYYSLEYLDQLAYFNVYYILDGERKLIKNYFNNTYIPSNDEEFCYYTYSNDNTLEISFSPLANTFKPILNSTIEVEYFTTLGSKGNFDYVGVVDYAIMTENSDTFQNIGMSFRAISNATGGIDKLDRDAMKTKIIERISTRDSIITENDLKLFFNSINETKNINNGEISFIKKQDDVLKRLYSAFLLLRDNAERVIPTNTITKLELTKNDFSNANIDNSNNKHLLINDTTVFSMNKKNITESEICDECGNIITTGDNEKSNFVLDRYDIKLESTSKSNEIKNQIFGGKFNGKTVEDNKDLVYTCPYLIKIDKDPILKMSYYNMYINSDVNMSYSFVNGMVFSSLIINTVNIKKNDMINDSNNNESNNDISYTISFNLNASDDIVVEDFISDTEGKSRIKIYGAICDTESGKVFGYFPFERSESNSEVISSDSNRYHFSKIISSEGKFDSKDNLILVDSLMTDLNDENSYKDIAISENCIIKIIVYMYDEEKVLIDGSTEDFSEFNIKENYSPALVVNSMGNITFYNNLENIVNSTVNIKYTIGEGNNLKTLRVVDQYQDRDETITILQTPNGTSTYKKVESFELGPDNNPIDWNTKYFNMGDNSEVNNINEIYVLEMIPLVGLKYYLAYAGTVHNILDRYITTISDAIDRLENNTTIDLKFYNTFGPSQYYKSYFDERKLNPDTNQYVIEEKSKYLDRVDIIPNFEIYVYEANSEFQNKVVRFISDYIESCNNEKVIPISNLIRLLESNFNEIKFIEFNGISDEYVNENTLLNNHQLIKGSDVNLDTMTKQEIINYVPEYINLKKNVIKNTYDNDNSVIPEVSYSYNFLVHINTK